MPPKKDAFADLFSSATGNSQSSSLNSSLNNLSLHDQKPKPQNAPWSNLDILSPQMASPQDTKSNTPKPNATEFDPFSIFDSKLASSPSLSSSMNHSPSISQARVSPGIQTNNERNTRPTGEISLLDDDFTDAYVSPPPEPQPSRQPRPDRDFQSVSQPIAHSVSQPVAPTPERANISTPARSQSAQAMDDRDTVLAELIDIGFPIEVANRAIDEIGTDLQACVNHIMGGGQSRGSNSQSRNKHRNEERHSTMSPDLGSSLQDISSDILKKASWFLDKSKKTVIKNINQFQNGPMRDSNNSMPTWMKNQSKYKAGALERKGNGESYEDYGEDEDNINSDEIQRIMRQQREREAERQRERLENMGKSSSGRSSRSSNTQARSEEHATSGRSSPAVAPGMPARPSSTPNVRRNRLQQPAVESSKVAATKPVAPQPTPARPKTQEPEVDLLGLGGVQPLSRAERFKQDSGEGQTYVSPSRRRPNKSTKQRNATAETLNAFQQSDFETFKVKATTSFTQGDYGDALSAYSKCLEALPPKHELRIVIYSNLAITQIKLGNYKTAKEQCEEGIQLVGDGADDAEWAINEKSIKYWYIKLLTRKAETLEMLECFPESLQCYMDLVTKHGVTDKKVMDAKRRINNIVNPPKPVPKAQSKHASPAPNVPLANTEQVQKIRQQHQQEKLQDEMKFKLHDQVHDRIAAWTNGKEDNLRTLLMSLDEVIPAKLGFPFLQKKITISDLMLTKKVKINYMKVISSIHPDKLSKFDLEDQMICQAVFVALNKAWDTFKEQNSLN